MSRLSQKEKNTRVKLARKLIQSKAQSKAYGKEFRRLNRIYLKAQKLKENGYEFAKASPKISDKNLAKNKRLIRKIYPNAKFPKAIKGYFIPRQVAGPNPRIKFTDSSFSVGGPGLPETEFVPVEPEIFTGEDTDQDKVDRILAQFNDRDILEPIAENGADLSQYGYAKRKKAMRKLILDWIATYGWAQPPPDSEVKNASNHVMQNWFAGVRILKGRDESNEES